MKTLHSHNFIICLLGLLCTAITMNCMILLKMGKKNYHEGFLNNCTISFLNKSFWNALHISSKILIKHLSQTKRKKKGCFRLKNVIIIVINKLQHSVLLSYLVYKICCVKFKSCYIILIKSALSFLELIFR